MSDLTPFPIADASHLVSPLQLLQTLRELFTDERRWTKKVSARNAAGRATDLWGEDVVACCALGGLDRLSMDPTGTEADDELGYQQYRAAYEALKQAAVERYSVMGIAYVNDIYGYEAVLGIIDLAIEKLEAQDG